jgi:RHS repeat-associated protein
MVLLCIGGSAFCLVVSGTCLPVNGGPDPVPYGLGEIGYFFYHNDHRGAPLYLTDEEGQVVWLARYRPYGEVEINENPDGDEFSLSQNLRYPGQYDDRLDRLLPLGENFYYNMNRYYDPSLGRYISPEKTEWNITMARESHTSSAFNLTPGGAMPIGIDVNPYSYADSNPITNVDPSGLLLVFPDEPEAYMPLLQNIGSTPKGALLLYLLWMSTDVFVVSKKALPYKQHTYEGKVVPYPKKPNVYENVCYVDPDSIIGEYTIVNFWPPFPLGINPSPTRALAHEFGHLIEGGSESRTILNWENPIMFPLEFTVRPYY